MAVRGAEKFDTSSAPRADPIIRNQPPPRGFTLAQPYQVAERSMAINSSSNRNTLVAAIAGAVLMVIFALLVVGGGRNGQPSSQSGPGNPMQTDQGR